MASCRTQLLPSGSLKKANELLVAALRVRARHPLARLEVLDLADGHPALYELGARGVDVGNDQVHTLDGARRRIRMQSTARRSLKGGLYSRKELAAKCK